MSDANPKHVSSMSPHVSAVLAVTRAENQTGQVPWREPGMNTFSENGNDFVGRLLHEGGVSRRTFSAFPQTQTARTVRVIRLRLLASCADRAKGDGFRISVLSVTGCF